MKKTLLAALIFAIPTMGNAYNQLIINKNDNLGGIPQRFSSSAQTESMEWGCPIAESVVARNSSEAMEKISQACVEDVRKAAAEKPGVFDVIQVSVVWPDVAVRQITGGYRLEGTMFIETLVMKQAGGK